MNQFSASPDFNSRRAGGNSSMLFDNPSKFTPSESLTSIDDIQEHEAGNPFKDEPPSKQEVKLRKKEEKAVKTPKSVRNTIIGGLGLGGESKSKNNNFLSEHAKTEQEDLKKLNKMLQNDCKTKVRTTG